MLKAPFIVPFQASASLGAKFLTSAYSISPTQFLRSPHNRCLPAKNQRGQAYRETTNQSVDLEVVKSKESESKIQVRKQNGSLRYILDLPPSH